MTSGSVYQVKKLLEHSQALLLNDIDAGLNRPHALSMSEALAELTGVSTDFDMNDWSDINTDKGVAISPVQAAKCLLETLRSQILMQGVASAIRDKINQQDNINILYAGTGPYGVLLLPFLALHKTSPVSVTLLDIHPENTQAIHELVTKLDIAHMVKRIVHADATTWLPEEPIEFDLIISETMNTLLRREPQVWIFSHLQQFLKPDGELIPQEIELTAWLCNPSSLTKSEQRVNPAELGSFFRLDKNTASALNENNLDVLSGSFEVPDCGKVYHTLELKTEIKVYREHRLTENQCSLNLPIKYQDKNLKAGDRITFEYINDPIPEFIFSFPDESLPNLPAYHEVGESGIFQIKRIFVKCQLNKVNKLDINNHECEWSLDTQIWGELELSLELVLEALYRFRLFEEFEFWLLDKIGNRLDDKLVGAINRKVVGFYS
ncbi:class I SAM-dependent methyltransferase [Pseudoalteromonas sp. L23]|uniref:class I SAM-dependent methyltransferase n=1 Tax=unclassified Pseudoalteromonas TaxID=194690 RepID=UPI001EF0DE57|nr:MULTISPECIES: class I SAM-dependent methyltransferase [unclassified Pseudoalteromonas]MCF7513657.1 class I SAM-dependent methyltransferase [Pseudoalteromonas sp. L7]MCF7525366.1 class I SAM-dependent methyltransferase [Pseudoalteromonas sp. L23]MCX2766121.1 class I SAM-dependent methyltransferase [Pseudoalteromonas sp. B530]